MQQWFSEAGHQAARTVLPARETNQGLPVIATAYSLQSFQPPDHATAVCLSGLRRWSWESEGQGHSRGSKGGRQRGELQK